MPVPFAFRRWALWRKRSRSALLLLAFTAACFAQQPTTAVLNLPEIIIDFGPGVCITQIPPNRFTIWACTAAIPPPPGLPAPTSTGAFTLAQSCTPNAGIGQILVVSCAQPFTAGNVLLCVVTDQTTLAPGSLDAPGVVWQIPVTSAVNRYVGIFTGMVSPAGQSPIGSSVSVAFAPGFPGVATGRCLELARPPGSTGPTLVAHAAANGTSSPVSVGPLAVSSYAPLIVAAVSSQAPLSDAQPANALTALPGISNYFYGGYALSATSLMPGASWAFDDASIWDAVIAAIVP